MIEKNDIKRFSRRSILHFFLIAGSILFSAPFVWLMSTSAKATDELYPPRWFPPSPSPEIESPYMKLRDNERAQRPLKVSEKDWNRLKTPILEALGGRLQQMQPVLPAFYSPWLTHPDLVEGIFARMLQKTPDALFTKVEDLAAGWFASNMTEKDVFEVFNQVYRRCALSDISFVAGNMETEKPLDAEAVAWEVLEGDVTLVEREEGLRRYSRELQYSFAHQDRFVLQTEIPVEMPLDTLKKIRIANHADRTWHSMYAQFAFAGRKYLSETPEYLNTDKWRDSVWQVISPDDGDVMVRTWISLKDTGSSDYTRPGHVRITLTWEKSSILTALLNKYTFNYREVVRRVPLWSYIRNSFFLVGMNIFGQLLASSLVAFAFARLRWPGRDFCFILVLATLMVPPQVTLIPVFLIFKQAGLYNTLAPLWIPAFFGNAFYIFLLRQFMRGIPADLEDSARIDGCGYFGIYYRIILPLIKPALAAIAIFTFMFVWNDFMGPLIFISDQELYPLSLGLFALHAMMLELAQHELMMAASVLMTIPVIILFFAAQRHFIQGITLTGLKG
jgi:multiple sugar transport system permease protein